MTDYELLEIDKYAVKSFNAMNQTNFEPQDITKWDKNLKNIDLIMHGYLAKIFHLLVNKLEEIKIVVQEAVCCMKL